MIVVKLEGGLGNQMFQYAVGRRLALMRDVGLKLDISWFKIQDKRAYSLKIFNIVENFATEDEINALTYVEHGLMERLGARILNRSLATSPAKYIEKTLSFNPAVLDLPGNVYLDGYWQSDKYFADIEDVIRADFTLKTEQKGKDREVADLISDCDSVSLHVRRGDYVSEPETMGFHGLCDIDYYLRAAAIIAQKIRDPHFFIFSDDADWARENLNLEYTVTVVDHNEPEKDFEDLRLLSQCRHHIIANSSFSWWGAWLGTDINKIVIAPVRWFREESHNHDDRFPSGWITT